MACKWGRKRVYGNEKGMVRKIYRFWCRGWILIVFLEKSRVNPTFFMFLY